MFILAIAGAAATWILIGADLRLEIREQRRAEPPKPNDVARGVCELFRAQLWRRPIGRLEILVEIDLEIMFDHPGERALARADRELRGLLAVVDLPQGDATVPQEGEIEYRIVNDRGDALEQLEGLCACLGDVDDRGALPAAVELQRA